MNFYNDSDLQIDYINKTSYTLKTTTCQVELYLYKVYCLLIVRINERNIARGSKNYENCVSSVFSLHFMFFFEGNLPPIFACCCNNDFNNNKKVQW